MPASTTVTGMVLSAMPVGDYDKRLVILTKDLGKITAFAKGARRPNSAFLACSQPFSFGEFSLYAGRSAYNIMSAEISNYFAALREDFEALCYGLYFCEFADFMGKEQSDERDNLLLIYQTLKALTKKTIDYPLIRAIFELRMMAIEGQAPQVFTCVKCNKEMTGRQSDFLFSAANGGILCDDCKRMDQNAIRIDTSALYAMQYIISKEIEKLYTFKVTDEILFQLKKCVKRYLECYLEHDFKSLEMLDSLK